MSISDAAPIVSGVSPANGPTTGGNTITINGYGFTSATEVDFVSAFNANGTEKTFVSATPTVISDNQMTVSAPAGALGTVDLIVTNDAGMSSQTANDHYTYSVSPAVAGVSPVGGPTAGNTTVTITGTNFAGLTAVNFGPNAAKSFHLVTNGDGSPYVDGAGYNEITAVTPASTLSGNGTGPVDVTVVANHITSGVNPPGDRFNYEITPSVTGISPKTGPDRGGTSVIITGTGFTSTSTVNFVDGSGNSTPATSVTFNSATQMTAVTPALALGTVVDVEVTNDIATSSASSLDKYTYGPTTIAVAETLTPSSSVTLDSTNLVVTAILSTNAFLVNDNTGSASIYGTLPATYTLPNGNTSTSSYVPTIGDKLSVTGTWSPYNQIPELAPTAVTLVSQGNPVATPLTETIPAVNLATLPFNIAGYMVTLRNVTIAGEGTAGSNFGTGNSPAGATITDGSNNTPPAPWISLDLLMCIPLPARRNSSRWRSLQP